VVFTNWAWGEPNNWFNEDCTEMYVGGKWNDQSCNKKRPFICKRPAPGWGEPGSDSGSSDASGDCLLLYQYDAQGDGWNGFFFSTYSAESPNPIQSVTLEEGFVGVQCLNVAQGSCYTFGVSTLGSLAHEISWSLCEFSGDVSSELSFCIDDNGDCSLGNTLPNAVGAASTCLLLYQYDEYGDGWNGFELSTYTPGDLNPVQSATLATGSYGVTCMEVALDACYSCAISTVGSKAEEVSWSLCGQTGTSSTQLDFCIDAAGNCFTVTNPTASSCEGLCGESMESCYCDYFCVEAGDCCEDACDTCGYCPEPIITCEEACGEFTGSCYCDDSCIDSGDCCDDACSLCGYCEPAATCNGACNSYTGTCYCDSQCVNAGDCCDDACTACGYCSNDQLAGEGNCVLLYQYDSFGDGWNGYFFSLFAKDSDATAPGPTTALQTVTLSGGSTGVTCLDVAENSCYTFGLSSSGSWSSEISWLLCGLPGDIWTEASFCIDAGGSCFLSSDSSGDSSDDNDCLPLHQYDSYGDGWNGYYFSLFPAEDSTTSLQSVTLANGGLNVACLDVDKNSCYRFSASTPGWWPTEISWSLCGFMGDAWTEVYFCTNGVKQCSSISDEPPGSSSGFQCDIVYGSDCYWISPTPKKYNKARQICEAEGSTLASIGDSTLNFWLGTQLVSSTWIGLRDHEQEGTFEWDDNSEVVFTNWAWGEPNNWFNEDCTEMYVGGKWNDQSCNKKRPFICKRPATGEEDGRCINLFQFDTYGDGWNGYFFSLWGTETNQALQSVTLADGFFGTACLDLQDDSCYSFGVSTIGGWANEISWSMCDNTGDVSTELSFCTDSFGNCIDPVLLTVSANHAGGTSCLNLYQYDSFGDGWNGYYFSLFAADTSIALQSVTLSTGSSGSECLEVVENCCYTFGVSTPGSWASEISWALCDADGDTSSELAFCINSEGDCILWSSLADPDGIITISDGEFQNPGLQRNVPYSISVSLVPVPAYPDAITVTIVASTSSSNCTFIQNSMSFGALTLTFEPGVGSLEVTVVCTSLSAGHPGNELHAHQTLGSKIYASATSQSIVVYDASEPPQFLSAISLDASTALVQFRPPSSDNNAVINEFTVFYAEAGSMEVLGQLSLSRFQFAGLITTGLEEDGNYRIWATATNMGGESSSSLPVTFKAGATECPDVETILGDIALFNSEDPDGVEQLSVLVPINFGFQNFIDADLIFGGFGCLGCAVSVMDTYESIDCLHLFDVRSICSGDWRIARIDRLMTTLDDASSQGCGFDVQMDETAIEYSLGFNAISSFRVAKTYNPSSGSSLSDSSSSNDGSQSVGGSSSSDPSSGSSDSSSSDDSQNIGGSSSNDPSSGSSDSSSNYDSQNIVGSISSDPSSGSSDSTSSDDSQNIGGSISSDSSTSTEDSQNIVTFDGLVRSETIMREILVLYPREIVATVQPESIYGSPLEEAFAESSVDVALGLHEIRMTTRTQYPYIINSAVLWNTNSPVETYIPAIGEENCEDNSEGDPCQQLLIVSSEHSNFHFPNTCNVANIFEVELEMGCSDNEIDCSQIDGGFTFTSSVNVCPDLYLTAEGVIATLKTYRTVQLDPECGNYMTNPNEERSAFAYLNMVYYEITFTGLTAADVVVDTFEVMNEDSEATKTFEIWNNQIDPEYGPGLPNIPTINVIKQFGLLPNRDSILIKHIVNEYTFPDYPTGSTDSIRNYIVTCYVLNNGFRRRLSTQDGSLISQNYYSATKALGIGVRESDEGSGDNYGPQNDVLSASHHNSMQKSNGVLMNGVITIVAIFVAYIILSSLYVRWLKNRFKNTVEVLMRTSITERLPDYTQKWADHVWDIRTVELNDCIISDIAQFKSNAKPLTPNAF